MAMVVATHTVPNTLKASEQGTEGRAFKSVRQSVRKKSACLSARNSDDGGRRAHLVIWGSELYHSAGPLDAMASRSSGVGLSLEKRRSVCLRA